MAQIQPQMTPEQLQALQEKIKNMSPEELKEFQKKQCIFCQIIEGKVQSKKIYEDNACYGILDINPANPGHVLLMTKEHYSIMPQIPDDEITHISAVAKSISNIILRSLEAQGTNIVIANGVAAGQRAQHFMIHIIPRKDGDGIEFQLPQKQMRQQELDELGDKISAALNSMLGVKRVEGRKEEVRIQTAPKIVEAEFKEPQKKPKQVEKGSPKDKVTSDINLDDIARLLGAK